MKESKKKVKALKIKKNDQVKIIAGNDKGYVGKVLKVFPRNESIIVEGANFINRHQRPTSGNPQGTVIKKEAPIHVSKVLIICPKCGASTRVGKAVLDTGSSVRICKKCHEMIDA
ncbi:50S ribosomal protein L24 [bacterium]|nr:50S ribosomal protein L24 [bacterium]